MLICVQLSCTTRYSKPGLYNFSSIILNCTSIGLKCGRTFLVRLPIIHDVMCTTLKYLQTALVQLLNNSLGPNCYYLYTPGPVPRSLTPGPGPDSQHQAQSASPQGPGTHTTSSALMSRGLTYSNPSNSVWSILPIIPASSGVSCTGSSVNSGGKFARSLSLSRRGR